MTLEDFFTSTELKDGLTAITHVEELVDAIQREKELPVKNIGDATRQWSTVATIATTIAATENKDCLDLFKHSGGVGFIGKWLEDAQTSVTEDVSNCFVEESISGLLLSLEKLEIDSMILDSTDLLTTIGSLCSHKSSSIQDRARALLDSWKQLKEGAGVPSSVEKDGQVEIGDKLGEKDETALCSSADLQNVAVNEEYQAAEPSQKEVVLSECCNELNDNKSEPVQAEKVELPREESSHVTSSGVDAVDKCSDVTGSPVKLVQVQDDLSVKEGHTHLDEKSEAPGSLELNQEFHEEKTDIDKSNHSPKHSAQNNEHICSEDNMMKLDISSVSSASVPEDIFSNVETECGKGSISKPVVRTDDDDDDNAKPTLVKTLLKETQMDESNNGLGSNGVLKCCTTAVEHSSAKVELSLTNPLPESSGDRHLLEKMGDPVDTLHRLEDVGKTEKVKGRIKKVKGHMADAYAFVKRKKGAKNSILSGTSDMDLEYGAFDALEVARQVAKEVEKQVEDYNERFDSSASEQSSPGGIGLLDGSDSESEEQDEHEDSPLNERPAGENDNAPLSESPKTPVAAENLNSEQQNSGPDRESSQVAEAAREPEMNPDRSGCAFDLNLDFCSEDAEHAVDSISNPVSVVSASRAAAAPGAPAAPLQFEGRRGWKGSAATSAFRPASPRRISDSNKVVSVGGTSSGSRQRHDSLEIDLNIADEVDDKNVNAVDGHLCHPLSSLPSGESSVESRRADKPRFDLNMMGEEGDVQHSDWKVGGHLVGFHTGRHSPSPASSSSSMKPPIRNFDLNDRPVNIHESSDHRLFIDHPTSRRVDASTDKTDISIMGTRVQENTFSNQIHYPLSFLNGRTSEVPNMPRPGTTFGTGSPVPVSNPTFYGYNGLTMNPGGTFSTAMYGPGPGGSFPYVVDPRGAVPQVVGSSSTLPSPYAQPQPPYVMNMLGGPLPGLNGASPSRPSLDLNSGLTFEGGHRDHPSGFRQFLIPGLARPLDDQLMRDNLQPSCSAIGAKRKEPEGGWEPFLTNYKQQPPHL